MELLLEYGHIFPVCSRCAFFEEVKWNNSFASYIFFLPAQNTGFKGIVHSLKSENLSSVTHPHMFFFCVTQKRNKVNVKLKKLSKWLKSRWPRDQGHYVKV